MITGWGLLSSLKISDNKSNVMTSSYVPYFERKPHVRCPHIQEAAAG